jgi:hypothetical protein
MREADPRSRSAAGIHSASIGKAASCSSISAQIRDTVLSETPLLQPNARTRSSTLRVKMAGNDTAHKALSTRRSGANSEGKMTRPAPWDPQFDITSRDGQHPRPTAVAPVRSALACVHAPRRRSRPSTRARSNAATAGGTNASHILPEERRGPRLRHHLHGHRVITPLRVLDRTR